MQKYLDLIKNNLIPFAFALFVFIVLLPTGGIIWAIGGAVSIFGLLYLKQNAFNPFANKWIRIGGLIVVIFWIITLVIRAGIGN